MTQDTLIAASIALARPQVATAEHFVPCVLGLSASLVELPDLESATFALDVSLLLSGERLLPAKQTHGGALATALRGYEDHLLARLVSDRRWLQLQEAWLAAPAAVRPTAAGLLIERLCRRLQVPHAGRLSQAAVRRLQTRTPRELVDEGLAALVTEPELAPALTGVFEALAKAARRERTLLSDAEVFLLENVATLEGLGPRVALGQLADAAQAVEERLPARMKMSSRNEGEAPTALEQESALPVGGWSSLSNSGSPESMVTSELIYMEENERPDLFDVRFVEGELLYYARDESVALRKSRTLSVVLDASLDDARLLDEGERHQRLLWALAAVTAAVRKLSSWLSHEALSFELVFVRGNGAHALEAEQGVVALLLREWQERGRLTLSTADSVQKAIERVSDEHGARADVVVVSTVALGSAEGRFRRAFSVTVNASPELQLVSKPGAVFDTGPAAERWAGVTKGLLSGLLG
ncbi:MAG: hypothetical protein JNK82_35660 [Myxococcaceae bacterium]|nr:hypothetical protein [Myxococcaceae bacterium]